MIIFIYEFFLCCFIQGTKLQHTYHFMFVNPKTHIGNKHFDHIGVFCG